MSRVLGVLVLVSVFTGCAARAPQPSAAPSPSASASVAAVNPHLSPRAYCFESRGVWRPTAVVCEYEVP